MFLTPSANLPKVISQPEAAVAIPSNRVNVSYMEVTFDTEIKGSGTNSSRNPLKSGQCFLPPKGYRNLDDVYVCRSQSPQIGSMFLTDITLPWGRACGLKVAIPSNRVNVSYEIVNLERNVNKRGGWSQSPQIGSMFLTTKNNFKMKGGEGEVAIPSNRVNVSYAKFN